MRNTINKAATLLFLVMAAVAIPYIYSLLFAQDEAPNKVNLPIVVNGSAVQQSDDTNSTSYLVASSIADSVPYTENIGKIIVSKGPAGFAVGVVMSGNLTDALHTPYDAVIAETMDRLVKESVAETQIVEASGPTTEGSTITIAGKSVKLLKGFYIEAFHLRIDCPIDVECLTPPVYAIANTETGHILGVSATTGKIGSSSLRDDELANLRGEFSWLVDALEVIY